MRRRRWFGWCTVVALLAAFLVGCGQQPHRLTFRLWDPQVAKAYTDSFAAFERKTGIGVDVEVVPWADYWEQLRIDIAAGAAPDIFWVNAANFVDYERAGALVDIAGRFSADDRAGWDPRVVRQYTADGGLWGVPQLTDPGIGLFYNKELLANAGVSETQVQSLSWDPASTTDSLRSVAAALTQDAEGRTAGDPAFDPDRVQRWGYSASNDLNAILLQFVGSNGAAWQEGDKFVFDAAPAEDAVRYVVGLINSDHVAPAASATNPPAGGDAARDLFLQGRLALFQTGGYNLANIVELASFRWGIAPLPSGPAGAISVTNGVVAAASAKSDLGHDQQLALEWIGSPVGAQYLGVDGSALPAVLAAQNAYFEHWSNNGVDVSPLMDVLDNGYVQPPQGARYAAAENAYRPILNEVFAGREPVDEGLARAAAAANAAMSPDS